MPTLNDLITDLKTLDPALPLVFATDDGEIGGGYHVTELKRADIHSIDCGGNLSSWSETNLQLLDGTGRDHMAVGKFISIAEHSMAKIDALSDGPLSFEYSPQNIGLHRYEAHEISIHQHKVQLHLTEDRAHCKPAMKVIGDAPTTGSGCCGSAQKTEASACCA